jgi:hypothetical protein
MATVLVVQDLRQLMYDKYPDESDSDETEHPVTAAGVVLLAATFLKTTQVRSLVRFAGYSEQFISAISFNMRNNRLCTNQEYDYSKWLGEDGTIDDDELWNHIEIACGNSWMPNARTDTSMNACQVYWDEQDRFARRRT